MRNIEALTLLTIYHLRSASSHALWYLIGHAMRACIDLGLHRKLHETALDPHTIQMRRRLFWTVYSLDCVISTTLGRPPAIASYHIDLGLPDEIQFSGPSFSASLPREPSQTESSNEGRESISLPLYFIRLRLIEANIYDTVYRTNQVLPSVFAKVPEILESLEELRGTLQSCTSFSGRSRLEAAMHWNRAVCLLLRPFLSDLQPSHNYYQTCLRGAGSICQALKRLQLHDGGHSFIAVQTIFVAGVTILYCIWTKPAEVWSISLGNDIRACSSVLSVMAERTGWVKRYRDAFDLLVTATMKKLEGGAGDGTILEATAAIATAGIPSDFGQDGWSSANGSTNLFGTVTDNDLTNTTNAESDNTEAMALINELANWLDNCGSSPAWMPDFETLENLPRVSSI